jgi:hypothetical protein
MIICGPAVGDLKAYSAATTVSLNSESMTSSEA